jgi:hypothetical protein
MFSEAWVIDGNQPAKPEVKKCYRIKSPKASVNSLISRLNGLLAKIEVLSGVSELMNQIYRNYICCVPSNAGDSDAELMSLAWQEI